MPIASSCDGRAPPSATSTNFEPRAKTERKRTNKAAQRIPGGLAYGEGEPNLSEELTLPAPSVALSVSWEAGQAGILSVWGSGLRCGGFRGQ